MRIATVVELRSRFSAIDGESVAESNLRSFRIADLPRLLSRRVVRSVDLADQLPTALIQSLISDLRGSYERGCKLATHERVDDLGMLTLQREAELYPFLLCYLLSPSRCFFAHFLSVYLSIYLSR